MLLTREHVQRIVNEKAATPFAQRNFLNTLRAMFKWATKEGRIPDDPTLGVTREKVKTTRLQDMVRGPDRALRGHASDRHEGAAGLRACCSTPASAAAMSSRWDGSTSTMTC